MEIAERKKKKVVVLGRSGDVIHSCLPQLYLSMRLLTRGVRNSHREANSSLSNAFAGARTEGEIEEEDDGSEDGGFGDGGGDESFAEDYEGDEYEEDRLATCTQLHPTAGVVQEYDRPRTLHLPNNRDPDRRASKRTRLQNVPVVLVSDIVSEISQPSVLFRTDSWSDSDSDDDDTDGSVPDRRYQDNSTTRVDGLSNRLSLIDNIARGPDSDQEDDNSDDSDGSDDDNSKEHHPAPTDNQSSEEPRTTGPSPQLSKEEMTLLLSRTANDVYDPTSQDLHADAIQETNLRLVIQVFELCRQPGIPRYFFDRLFALIRAGKAGGAKLDDYSFVEHSAESIFTLLEKKANITKPVTTYIAVETDRPQDMTVNRLPRTSTGVVTYNAKEQFLSVFGDEELFSQLPNLVISSPSTRWDQAATYDTSQLGEIIPAKASQDFIAARALVPRVHIYCPLVLYQDEIGVTQNQRQGVNPVLMALGLLRREVRYLEANVRPVGFIPKFDKRTKAQKKAENTRKAGKGRGVRNYHACLDVVLQEIRSLQEHLAKNPIWTRLGDELRLVYVVAPIIFYIGDAKAMDILAARYGSYVKSNRISRFCNATSEQAGIAGVLCQAVRVDDVKPEVERLFDVTSTREQVAEASEQLKKLCTHRCINSLWLMLMEGQKALPLPHDLMHIFSALMKTLFQLLISPLSDNEKCLLDMAVNEMMGGLHSGEKKNFPRTFFSNGVTSVTMLTAGEWVGSLLMTLMLLNSNRGALLMNQCLSRSNARLNEYRRGKRKPGERRKARTDTNGDVIELPPLDLITAEDAVSVIEDVLLFHAYAAYGHNLDLGEPLENSIFVWDGGTCEPRLRTWIGKLQSKILKNFPRESGSGWKTQKFHEMLHIPANITQFGHPSQFDSGWGERALKTFGKNPSKTVGLQYSDDFVGDVAHRLYEATVLQTVMSRSRIPAILGPSVEEQRQECNQSWSIRQSKPQWVVKTDGEGLLLDCVFQGHRNVARMVEMPQLIVERLVDLKKTKLVGYTEIFIKDDKKGNIVRLRCHPSYRGGQSFDWCLVDRQPGDNSGRTWPPHSEEALPGLTPPSFFPAKLLAVFENPEYDPDGEVDEIENARILCLIHTTKKMVRSSLLTEQWELEYTSKEVLLPPMDENLNVGNAPADNRSLRVKVPATMLVHPSWIKRRILVCEEFPLVRSYIDPRNYEHHSDNVVYIRDRKHFWSQIFSKLV